MLKNHDRLATVANALRASTSEPNLRKKLQNSGGSQKERRQRPIRSTSSTPDSMSTMSETPRTQRSTRAPKTPNKSTSSSARFSSLKQRPMPVASPLHGFNQGVFYGSEKVALNFIDHVRFIDGSGFGFKVVDRDYGGRVSAIQTSADFGFFTVSVDGEKGSKIVIHETKEIYSILREFPTTVLGDQICVSLTNETLLLVSGEPEGKWGTVALYGFEGTFLAETTVTPETPSNKFEVSFCPVDETIICLVTVDQCYLMRATTNIINTFSSIKFSDLTCHSWADDVTLAFGTLDGKIRLYRETVPLEIIDLKKLQKNLIGNKDPTQASVLKIFGNDQNLIVFVQIGLIFIFPAGDLKDRWKHSRIIVINSLKRFTTCSFLHIDQSNENVLYGDSESCWMCNVFYSEALCEDGMRLITARCSKSVVQICFESKSKRIAVFDSEGLILISSLLTKRILSFSKFKNIFGISFFPNGNRILIAEKDSISVYSILIYELFKESTVYHGDVQILVGNQTCEFAAFANPGKLTVIQIENFSIFFEIPLESNQDILQLKWSSDSEFIGILAKKDSIYFVDALRGQLLWNLEFKLRFFVDIALHGDTVFALGNKFTVAKIKNKKELEPMNVHFEGVSFNSTSTSVVTTSEGFYYGTQLGIILKAQADNVENVQLIKMSNAKGISKMEWIKNENIILTGHDDGSLLILDLNLEDDSVSNSDSNRENYKVEKEEPPEDTVTCRFNEFEKNKFLVKELKVERNLIRNQCKRVFDDFKDKKEKEIQDLNQTLEANMTAMREKLRMIEDKYEARETAYEETISKMKADFKRDIFEQKNFYENMINDQIRASLAKDAEVEDKFKKIESDQRENLKKLESEFSSERENFEKKISELKSSMEKLRTKLFESESIIRLLKQNNLEEKQKNSITVENLKQKFEEEKKQMIASMKDLKATILIIENEKSAEVQNVRSQKIRLEALSDELAENQNLFDEKNSQIEKLQDRVSLLEKENEAQNKLVQKLNQKSIICSKDIEQEREHRRTAESRLKTFEAMVEAMSNEIYDPKKLEKNALGMLAFFKSPNQLLKRSRSHHITVKRQK